MTVPDVARPQTRVSTESDIERWRGTPELFAHLARVVQRVASDDEAAPATLEIDLEVEKDHELFSDADAFVTAVTPEGLRSFETISVTARGPSHWASVTFRWRREWWKPGTTPDGEVIVELDGEADWRTQASTTIETALARGHGRMGSGNAAGVTGFGIGTALVIVCFSLAALFDAEVGTALIVGAGACWLGGMVAGAFLGTWLIPSLEIAPRGQFRITRVGKWVGSLVLAIALAGLSKALFG